MKTAGTVKDAMFKLLVIHAGLALQEVGNLLACPSSSSLSLNDSYACYVILPDPAFEILAVY